MGLNTSRALEAAEPADERRAASHGEHRPDRRRGARQGRRQADGAQAGRAVPGRRPVPEAAAPARRPRRRTPAASAEPPPRVTVDKASRVLGSMVGRRLAERKKDDG